MAGKASGLSPFAIGQYTDRALLLVTGPRHRQLLRAHFLSLTAVLLLSREVPAADVREIPEAIVIEGSALERGHAYGKRFRDEIRSFLDEEIFAPFTGKPSTREEMLAYAAACGTVVREVCPGIAEEVRGIAEGAGLSFEEIVLIQLHEELYHRAPLPGPKAGHCTAVAVAPADSGDGHAYVGQTWDWMESVAGKSRVIEWRRGEAASVLAYGFPGMPVGAGVSSGGIALCWTSAALDKGGSARVGIPSYTLIAHLLAQKDLDAVIREARKDRHAGWFTFVMADGSGRLLNIEGTPRGVVVEEAKTRLARVDLGSADAGRVLRGGPISLHPRCRKMYDLLEASQGKNDLARLQDYFADGRFEINAGKPTIDMLVFDTTSRAAHVSRGSSYGVSWRRFAFGAK